MEHRTRNALVGLGALLVVGVAGWILALYLAGVFKPGFEISASFERAGQLLRNGSDVKLRGVLVGQVSRIEVVPSGGANITMLISPSQEIPSNVGAAIRAKTLFGEKYIDLEVPADPSMQLLAAGAEIPRSDTTGPFEVETILERALPILEAVDPEAFGASLRALAEAFVDNVDELRATITQSARLLTETERTLPNLERNLVHLRTFAAALDETDEDLLAALDGLTAVGEAIRSNGQAFRDTVSGLVPLTRDLGDILQARESDLADLASGGRAVLEEVRERKDTLPGTVEALDNFLEVWVADLSAGPYWRIFVTDPVLIGGTAYGPGESPDVRSAAIDDALSGVVTSGGRNLGDLVAILVDPLPADAVGEVASELGELLQGLLG